MSKGRIKEERGAGEPQCRGIDWRVHDYTLQLDPTRMSCWPFEILFLWEAFCLKFACAITWVTWRRNQSPLLYLFTQSEDVHSLVERRIFVKLFALPIAELAVVGQSTGWICIRQQGSSTLC